VRGGGGRSGGGVRGGRRGGRGRVGRGGGPPKGVVSFGSIRRTRGFSDLGGKFIIEYV